MPRDAAEPNFTPDSTASFGFEDTMLKREDAILEMEEKDGIHEMTSGEMLDWEEEMLEMDKMDKFASYRIIEYSLLLGDPNMAGLYKRELREEHNEEGSDIEDKTMEVSAEDVIEMLASNLINSQRFIEHIHETWKHSDQDSDTYLQSLKALATADMVYEFLSDATVALRVISQTLCESLWSLAENVDGDPYSAFPCSRAKAFALVSMFETGTLKISPDSLASVIALATGDSICVAAPLVRDPKDMPLEHELRRIIGNIGRPGIAMLIPPECPRVREATVDSWKLVSHLDYDGKALDSYRGTSVHLAFTGYDQAVVGIGSHGAQDVEAYFLEVLVSVEDRGKWVADLDILSALKDTKLHKIVARKGYCRCGNHPPFHKAPYLVTAIDSWDELLDRPENAGIVRAHENWLARLALTSVSIQCQYKTVLLTDSPCWKCCKTMLPNIKKEKEFSSMIFIY